MAHPYQCLLYCHRPEQSVSQVLVAACGSYLHVFNVLNGQNLSSWTPTGGLISSSQQLETPSPHATKQHIEEDANDGLQPSPKRRKTSPGPIVSTESSSTEILVDNGDTRRDLPSNPITKLAVTSGGHHIVAVTGEDKCLRVFELSGDGTIKQISARIMPKRPCAITVSPGDSTILCGDKFGDVYALPLLGRPHEHQDANSSSKNGLATKVVKSGSQKSVPSATSLTVHTKRNLNALKQQQQQIPNHEKQEKKCLDIEHKLLFGHVSLLTDLACTALQSKSRNYILTSDRDEHVRVSRGVPQAHITVGYCQGHTEFVSKLCLIPSQPELLVTGGGDNFLILWDWLASTIEQRIDLNGIVQDLKRLSTVEVNLHNLKNDIEIVVSNIKPLELDDDQSGEKQTELVVSCEGMPALFFFTLDAQKRIRFRETYPTKGNVIDVVVLSDRRSVICSMDNIHTPFSTLADNGDPTSRRLIDAVHLSKSTQHWEEDSDLYGRLLPALENTANKSPMVPQTNSAKGKSLKELLYGLESLRKQRSGADASTEPAVEGEDVA